MKLVAALSEVTSLGIDTAPLIYFVEKHDSYLDIMRAVIQRIDVGELTGYSSVVTLTEVPTHQVRMGNSELEQEYRELPMIAAILHW